MGGDLQLIVDRSLVQMRKWFCSGFPSKGQTFGAVDPDHWLSWGMTKAETRCLPSLCPPLACRHQRTATQNQEETQRPELSLAATGDRDLAAGQQAGQPSRTG